MDGGAFEIPSEIGDVMAITAGRGVHTRCHLERIYGRGRWRKMKGIATIRFADGTVGEAENTGLKPMA